MNSKHEKNAVKASGLFSIPGLLKPRKRFCCLGCGIEHLGLKETFLEAVLVSSVSVEDIRKCEDDEVIVLMRDLTPRQKKVIFAVCDCVLEQHGEDYAQVIHHNFFKRRMDVVFQNQDYRYVLGQVEGGNVIQIFQSENESHVTSSILKSLEDDCLKIEIRNHQHQNYEDAHFENIVHILTKRSTIELVKPSFYGETSRKEVGIFYPEESFDDQLCALYRDLTITEQASLVVINKVTSNLFSDSDLEYVPCAWQWLEFLRTVYGDVTDTIIVMIIVYEDFEKKFGVTSKSEIRRMINKNVPQDVRGSIMWALYSLVISLDVSADNDLTTAEGTHMQLEIFSLND